VVPFQATAVPSSAVQVPQYFQLPVTETTPHVTPTQQLAFSEPQGQTAAATVTETASESVEQTRTASPPASQPEGQQAPDTQLQASLEPQGQTAAAIVTETAVLHTESVEQTRTASPPAS
jgi:phosphoribosylformylglycinamidine (FGAM) synthase PurS component